MANRPRRSIGEYEMRATLVTVAVVLLAMFILPALVRTGPHRRSSCANNLNTIGISLRMYAGENAEGYYPPLSAKPGTLMFVRALFPDYIPDALVLLCPSDDDDAQEHAELVRDENRVGGLKPKPLYSHKDFIDDQSYFYLGYAVTSDQDVALFAAAYRTWGPGDPRMRRDIDANNLRGSGITADGSFASGEKDHYTLYRLREGVEDELIDRLDIIRGGTDPSARARSKIPVMIERPGNHEPDGINVLYLDGHVDFHRPREWPYTEKTIGLLRELDALGDGAVKAKERSSP